MEIQRGFYLDKLIPVSDSSRYGPFIKGLRRVRGKGDLVCTKTEAYVIPKKAPPDRIVVFQQFCLGVPLCCRLLYSLRLGGIWFSAVFQDLLYGFLIRGDVDGFLVFIDHPAWFGAVGFVHVAF